MKTLGAAVGAALVLAGLAAEAGTVTFSTRLTSYYNYVTLRDPAGSVVNRLDNWVLTLWRDVDNDGIDSPGAGTWGFGDDECLFRSNIQYPGQNQWSANGVFYTLTADDIPDNSVVFARIFNASAMEGASLLLDLTPTGPGKGKYAGTGSTVPISFANNDNVSFTVEQNQNHNGMWDWQPVPEPATLALLGAGLAAVIARRRMRKA